MVDFFLGGREIIRVKVLLYVMPYSKAMTWSQGEEDNCELPKANYNLPIVNCQLQIVYYKLQM